MTSSDEYAESELVEKLGNMYLIKINDTLKPVPATYKNKLLYEKELYELLHPNASNERVVLTDENDEDFVAIAPTNNDSVYQLWVGENPHPVMNTPSKSEDILKGVWEAIESPKNYSRIKNLYEDIRKNIVRRTVIKKAESLFAQNEVIPKEDGWSIMGIFILTWDCRIFLDTGDIENQKAYSVSSSGVSEMDKPKEFLKLTVDDDILNHYKNTPLKIYYPLNSTHIEKSDCVTNKCTECDKETECQTYYDKNSSEPNRSVYVCTECQSSWKEYKLTEREIEFLYKINWLINHRKHLDDDAFWSVIESHVWHYDSK